VTEWIAYAAVAASCLPREVRAALSRREIDAVLHYSHRSAAILRQLAEWAGVLEGLGAADSDLPVPRCR
jgi:trehalose-6-phosphate synthase